MADFSEEVAVSGNVTEGRQRVSRRGLERTVGWLGVATLVALAGAFILFAAYGYRQAQERAESEAVAAAHLLAENAARFFDAVDYALDDATEQVAALSWQEVSQSRLLWERLSGKVSHFPYIDALWLNDESGRLRLATVAFPVPDSNAADREFFLASQQGNGGAFISAPIIGRVTNRSTFMVSRRLSDPAGQMRGIVSATIDPTYFEQFFRAMDLPGTSTILLFRATDLAVLVRDPAGDSGIPKPLPDDLAARLAGQPKTAVLRYGQHLVAVRQLQPWPVYVAVDIDKAAIDRGWRDSLQPYAGVLILAALSMLLFIRFAFHQARRAEQIVTELEARVDERTASLRDALGQKDMLMREINHRVKNSLQMVASFLTMQGLTAGEQAVRDHLEEASRRVRAISDAHQMLYSQGDVTSIRMDEFLAKLCRDVQQTAMASGSWDIRLEIAPLRLPTDTAIAVGLLANELLTNTAKHAYPAEAPNKPVKLRLGIEGEKVVLEVSDAGVGLPPDHGERQKRSLGMQVIHALARQIGGSLSIEPRNPGVAFKVALAT